MPGGFIGAGGKTVIPPKRRQRSRCAWWPDMRPDEIFKLYSDFVQSIVPKGIEIKIKSSAWPTPS